MPHLVREFVARPHWRDGTTYRAGQRLTDSCGKSTGKHEHCRDAGCCECSEAHGPIITPVGVEVGDSGGQSGDIVGHWQGAVFETTSFDSLWEHRCLYTCVWVTALPPLGRESWAARSIVKGYNWHICISGLKTSLYRLRFLRLYIRPARLKQQRKLVFQRARVGLPTLPQWALRVREGGCQVILEVMGFLARAQKTRVENNGFCSAPTESLWVSSNPSTRPGRIPIIQKLIIYRFNNSKTYNL